MALPMSSEVRDDNPYSRLMALQRMGVVRDYERIRQKTVAVVGVGGVGAVVTEMLTRCGIGRLLLWDYDKVELANMNRLFFTRDQQGLFKVEAARQTLHRINPDVEVQCHTYSVSSVAHFDHFCDQIRTGGLAGPVDLVLSCVDNFEARMAINQACLECNQPWMESGVSENAVSGHIQLLMPGATPCYQCFPPLIVAEGLPELERQGVCAASLPTTMGIIAGLLAQNVLKYLLHFGQVTGYLGYNALQDFFPTTPLKPNPSCSNDLCRQRQEEQHASAALAVPVLECQTIIEVPSVPAAEANQWGLTVDEVYDGDDSVLPAGVGLQYAFGPKTTPPAVHEPQVDDGEEEIESLAQQLKAFSNAT